MKKFAKLYDVSERQLLVFIEPDNDNEKDEYSKIHQMTDIGGAVLDIAMSGPDAAMEKVFDEYSDDTASRFFTIPMLAKVISAFAGEAA